MSEELLKPGALVPYQWYKADLPKTGLEYVMVTSQPYSGYYNGITELFGIRIPIKKRGATEVAAPAYRGFQIESKLACFTRHNKPLPVSVEKRFRAWSREPQTALPTSSVTVTLGTDPEIFVVDKDEQVIPAWKFLPKKPTYTPSQFWDGFQAEWTVMPNTCLAYLTDEVQNGMRNIRSYAVKFNPDAKLTWKSVLPVSQTDLTEAAEEHVQLGCSPSVNIYEKFTPPVSSGRELPIRFAGCHIHFGHSPNIYTDEHIRAGVEMADALGAVAVTCLLEGLEHEARRQFYGRPGEHRISAGRGKLEYRALSSGVLIHPAVFHLSVDLLRMGFKWGLSGLGKYIWDYDPQYVRSALLNYDIKSCKKILKANEAVLRKVLSQIYGSGADKSTLPVLEKGIRQFIDISPGCIEKHWHLSGSWPEHSAARDAQWSKFLGNHSTALLASA